MYVCMCLCVFVHVCMCMCDIYIYIYICLGLTLDPGLTLEPPCEIWIYIRACGCRTLRAPILYAHLSCQTASFFYTYMYTPAAQQLPYYMHISAVKQLHACIHTCTPAAQQLPYYMHTSAVTQLHGCTYMYSSCPAAPILYAYFSCQAASCLYVHVLQLPSSSHIVCTLQLGYTPMRIGRVAKHIESQMAMMLTNAGICRPPFVQHGHHRIQIRIWGTRAKVSRYVKVDLSYMMGGP
jgi:hypothetical protein